MTTDEINRSVLKEMRGNYSVAQSYMVWEALKKAVEKNDEILNMTLETCSPSEAWSALTKMATETNGEVIYRVEKDFEALLVQSNENVGEYFARVKVLIFRAKT